MARGKEAYAKQIVNLLRQIEGCGGEREDDPRGVPGVGDHGADVLPLAQGSLEACRWTSAQRLRELEQENAELKRLASELSLEKLVLKDIASGNF